MEVIEPERLQEVVGTKVQRERFIAWRVIEPEWLHEIVGTKVQRERFIAWR